VRIYTIKNGVKYLTVVSSQRSEDSRQSIATIRLMTNGLMAINPYY